MGAAAERAGLTAIDRIAIRDIEVDGQILHTAIAGGPTDQPPLLMFNGIGANLELATPLLKAMTDRRMVIFDVP
ncbi:MAG: poly(3-hydroxyalkanoate) depolymerase, partial [Pseudomonadota bacterium]